MSMKKIRTTENYQKTSKLVTAQWVFAAIGAMMGVSAFSRGFLGIFGGLFLLVSAFVISPLAEKLPVYEKISFSKIMKVVLQFVISFILCSIGLAVTPSNNNNTEDMSLDTSMVETQNTETETEADSEAVTEEESETETETESEAETETQNTETGTETDSEVVTEEESEVETETIPAHREEGVAYDSIIGISDKSLTDDGIEVQYSRSVPNDTTGKWRLAKIYDDIDFMDYALSYYNKYVKNDEETHIIINFARNETIVFHSGSEFKYVDVHEYIDGEENDAKVLAGGDVISEYVLYLDNGDIGQLNE